MGMSQTLFSSGVGAVGDYGRTEWTPFGIDLAAGEYTIEAGMANVGDDQQPSLLLLDGVSVIAVPEPATWALMIMGFGGVGAMIRSRKAVIA